MKQKILDALKTKFEGVDAKILDRIATKMAKTVKAEDEVEPAVEKVTFQEILTSYGDARATEATQTAVSNYEKKHGLKDGKKVNTDGDDDSDDDADDADDDATDADGEGGKGGKKNPKAKSSKKDDDTMPAWAKALIEGNKALKDRLDAMDKGKVTASRKEKLNKAIEKLTDKQKKPYGRVSLDGMSDEEFDSFLEEVTTDAEEMAAENDAYGSAFSAPLGGNHSSESKSGKGIKLSDSDLDKIAESWV